MNPGGGWGPGREAQDGGDTCIHVAASLFVLSIGSSLWFIAAHALPYSVARGILVSWPRLEPLHLKADS